MKIIKNSVLATLMVLLLSSAALKQSSTSKRKTDPAETNKGFAVLELFTSEGCSSCPRADDLMARIQKESGDKPVYILSYHIDYWNRLGWKDIFSSAQYTERQYQYHRWFTSQVYTPQLIINGSAEFVGGDAAGISKEVQKVMSHDASTTLSLQAKLQSESTELHYQISGNINKEQLLIAVVQKHAVNKVKRGENEGRTLSHVQIVRQFYSFALTPGKKGMVKIPSPADFNAAEWEIIGMLQDPNTGVISAATRAAVPFATAPL